MVVQSMIEKASPPVRGLILDMDGVLWRDTSPIGDLPRVFARIEQLHIKYVLATNNATRSVRQFIQKLRGFGVDLPAEAVVNSAQAVAYYLKQQHPQGGPVYIIGEEGLHETLSEFGFPHGEDDPVAVVVGLDRKLEYRQLKTACTLIRRGAPFIGTNPDTTLPTPEGLIPGAGSIIAALEAATDVKAFLIGKPGPILYNYALSRLGTTVAETLAVGDRLSTDIAGAQSIGFRTALVLSGVTSRESALAWKPAPDYIADDLAQLVGLSV